MSYRNKTYVAFASEDIHNHRSTEPAKLRESWEHERTSQRASRTRRHDVGVVPCAPRISRIETFLMGDDGLQDRGPR